MCMFQQLLNADRDERMHYALCVQVYRHNRKCYTPVHFVESLENYALCMTLSFT